MSLIEQLAPQYHVTDIVALNGCRSNQLRPEAVINKAVINKLRSKGFGLSLLYNGLWKTKVRWEVPYWCTSALGLALSHWYSSVLWTNELTFFYILLHSSSHDRTLKRRRVVIDVNYGHIKGQGFVNIKTSFFVPDIKFNLWKKGAN